MDSLLIKLSDWLNLDKNMAKNYSIDVGDADAINEAINKQKVYIVATFYSFHLK